ncbi:MAG TPA: hypothetical protein VH814_02890 [Steroidobacteraceae bacterium]
MSEQPSPDEAAIWQRRLASQANNRAWTLAESLTRTPEQDEEMLQAAHAAMYFWKIVGNPRNRAHAAQLVAHAYALLGQGGPAGHFQAQSQPVLLGAGAEAWEQAMAHAVAANVAAANNDTKAQREHYRNAVRLMDSLPEADRKVLNATLRVVPQPKDPT